MNNQCVLLEKVKRKKNYKSTIIKKKKKKAMVESLMRNRIFSLKGATCKLSANKHINYKREKQ